MPADPTEAAQLAGGTLDVLAGAEARLLDLIGGTLTIGLEEKTWEASALGRVQTLRVRLEAVTKSMEQQAEPEIQRAILDAWQAGSDSASADLEQLTTPRKQGPRARDAALIGTENVQRQARQSIGQLSAQAAFRSGQIYEQTARQIIAEGTVGAGVTRRDLTARLLEKLAQRGVDGFTDAAGRNWNMYSYGEMVTRTTLQQALVSGHIDQLAEQGQDLVMVSDAPAECKLCRPFEGRILTISGATGRRTEYGETFDVVATVADARRRGLFHPNAVLGTQPVAILGATENACQAKYVGPSVHLTTARGNELTVSPNHPVLTTAGWKRADNISKGDQVFSGPPVQRVGNGPIPDEQLDYPVTTTQQVFDALAATGYCTTGPATADDFHGDGRSYQGDVHVVWAEGTLRGVPNAVPVEQCPHGEFVRAGVQVEPFAGGRSLQSGGAGVGGPVLRALPDGDAGGYEAAADGRVADSEDWREVLAGLAAGVTADQVVNVERDWFVGHAFDFQTSTGAYLTGGIVTHNCRHRLVAFLPGITQRLTDTADPEGDQLRQAQRAHERRIRALKRRQQAAEQATGRNSVQAKRARAAVTERQREFKAFRDENGLKDLSYRTRIDIGNTRRGPAGGPVNTPARPLPAPTGPRTPTPKAGPPGPPPVVTPRPVIPDFQLPTKRRGKRTPPADMRDWNARELRDAGDDELGAALEAAITDDHAGLDRLIGEMDRREQAPFIAQANAEKRRLAAQARRDAVGQAEADRVADLINGGMDPYEAVEQVTGVTIAKQLQTEAFYRLRAEGRSGSFDEMARQSYREEVARRYVEAENACRGQMLSREANARNARANAKGLRNVVDPERLFFGNYETARANASDELREWWDVNGRPSFDEYRESLITGANTHRDGQQDFLR